MPHTDWFENWFASPYYKILYESHNNQEAEDFVDKLVNQLRPQPDSKMLDIGCYEGRHSIQLASYGYQVTGIDLSRPGIEKAKQHENERLQFFVQDMRFPFYINHFDYAFNFFTSFGYFNSNRDNQMAARAFAAGLKKSGILVIDYMNVIKAVTDLVPEETVHREQYTFNIRRRVENNQILKDIDFTDEEGKHRHYMERVAAFTLPDFIRLFTAAGLNLIDTFGDYQLDKFDPNTSPRLIMVFQKQ